MNLIIMLFMIIIIFLGMDISVILHMLKNLADNEYKINTNTLEEYSLENDSAYQENLNLLSYFMIPFQYIINSEEIFNYLKINNLIEQMSEEEINDYNKNPSIIKAFKIFINSSSNINNIELKDGSKIYYKYINNKELSINNILIIKTIGNIEKLSVEEQKRVLINELEYKIDKVLNKYKEKESFHYIDNVKNVKDNLNSLEDINNIKKERPKILSKKKHK